VLQDPGRACYTGRAAWPKSPPTHPKSEGLHSGQARERCGLCLSEAEGGQPVALLAADRQRFERAVLREVGERVDGVGSGQPQLRELCSTGGGVPQSGAAAVGAALVRVAPQAGQDAAHPALPLRPAK